MSDFNKVMKETSDLELYRILYHKRNSYTQEALQSAEREFKHRNLSNEKINELEERISKEKEIKIERANKNLQLEQTIRSSINMAIPTHKDTLEKSILSLTIFLSITYLYFLISDFQELIWVIQEMNVWSIYAILPFILFPIGIYGLWKVRGYGWDIIVGLLTHYAVITIHQLYMEYGYYGAFTQDGLLGSLNDLFPRTPIGLILLNFIVFSGIIIFLTRKKVLDYFSINRLNGIIFIAVVAVLTMLYNIYVFD